MLFSEAMIKGIAVLYTVSCMSQEPSHLELHNMGFSCLSRNFNGLLLAPKLQILRNLEQSAGLRSSISSAKTCYYTSI
jgi:hypothetical protein